MRIIKIALSGGVSGGKSSAKKWIEKYFRKLGYTVLFVSETATDLFSSGISYRSDRPEDRIPPMLFQELLFRLQTEKEAIFTKAAESLPSDKVLIFYDRGLPDNKAYMSEEEFEELLEAYQTNEVEVRDHYDAVFHLLTPAKDAPECYNTENNPARTETPEEAIIGDDKLLAIWTGHPHFRIIDNSTDFDNKMKRLLKEISDFIGEPAPFEIERKFLIEYPDKQWLESQPSCKRIEIIQTYLKSDDPDEEIRIRQRGADGNYLYFKTSKRKISEIRRVEVEEHLTKDEYIALLMEADTSKRQIRKTRYCLTYENQSLEIDVYPFWNHQAILEIELNDENTPVNIPEQLKIIKEVTEDPSYKNAALATV